MAANHRADAGRAEPDADLVAELLEELGRAFSLSAAIGDRTLGEAMESRLRRLHPGKSPEWGGKGEIAQVAKRSSEPLDFYYRPHLFPDMDPALRLGHQLQFDLLPRTLPSRSPVKIAAVLESYCHLSGDLLGWRQDGDEIFLWIADVSGHGIRAGLAAAVLYFLIGAIEPECPPGEFARRIDRSMRASRNPRDHRSLYATGFWLRVAANGCARYASAGHLPMVLRRRDGTLETLPSTGPPVSLVPEGEFLTADLRLEHGDTLCLFTDGVVEATDEGGQELGEERLAAVLETERGGPLAEAQAIYRAVREHRETGLLDDDLTFMVVELAG